MGARQAGDIGEMRGVNIGKASPAAPWVQTVECSAMRRQRREASGEIENLLEAMPASRRARTGRKCVSRSRFAASTDVREDPGKDRGMHGGGAAGPPFWASGTVTCEGTCGQVVGTRERGTSKAAGFKGGVCDQFRFSAHHRPVPQQSSFHTLLTQQRNHRIHGDENLTRYARHRILQRTRETLNYEFNFSSRYMSIPTFCFFLCPFW